jgi:hypothetical protein
MRYKLEKLNGRLLLGLFFLSLLDLSQLEEILHMSQFVSLIDMAIP